MPDTKATQDHQHQRIQVRSVCADCGAELGQQEFSRADVEQQQMTELPDREAMSLVNANLAIPINLAAALNVLSDGSIAQAGALQQAPIGQTA
ncbi:MAG: hypothetical protein JO247_12405 [Chloroflexi bacterium]|nr:hypothetical protein [Chloroflexota bacterium]